MVKMKVDASELKGEAKIVEKLSDFLEEKTGGEVATEGKTITVKGEGEALSKKYVRIGDEEALKVKERKLAEED